MTCERLSHRRIVHREQMAMLGGLVSGVAHEISNPLAGIVGLGDLVVEDLRETGSADVEDVEGMVEQARRAIGILHDLLDLASQTGDGREICDLNDVVRAAVGLLRFRFCVRRIEVSLDLAEGLSPLPAAPRAIERIVISLLLNALQAFSDPDADGGSVRLRTSTGGARDDVCFEIEDDGMGIPTEHGPYVFEPYFSTGDPSRHSGLGLPLAREIARRHAGELRLDTTYRGGARFVLTLPTRLDAAALSRVGELPAAERLVDAVRPWEGFVAASSPAVGFPGFQARWPVANDDATSARQGGSDGAA